MSIPKKKKGEWRVLHQPGYKLGYYHQDTLRNRAKRRYETIKRNVAKKLGRPITQRVKEGIKGTKAPTPLTKRHNIKR